MCQTAFEPNNQVPDIGPSPDKMLLGRLFACAITPEVKYWFPWLKCRSGSFQDCLCAPFSKLHLTDFELDQHRLLMCCEKQTVFCDKQHSLHTPLVWLARYMHSSIRVAAQGEA
tara:strand:+ start:4884 stop:5225 length:342 start_codon:yes stop_codon:yes gene_type:complete